MDSLGLAPGVIVKCVTEQAGALKNPPQTTDEVLETLRCTGLVRSVTALRDLMRS